MWDVPLPRLLEVVIGSAPGWDEPWAHRHVGPWYTHKEQPSFRDMLATARRLISAAREYSQEVDENGFQ